MDFRMRSKQNEYSKDIFGHERSTSESFADGASSFGRNLITNAFSSMTPFGVAGSGLLRGAMASSVANFGKPVIPENNDNSDKNKNVIASGAAPMPANGSSDTGWDSSFGNYDSHVKGFKYTPNSAYSAWG